MWEIVAFGRFIGSQNATRAFTSTPKFLGGPWASSKAKCLAATRSFAVNRPVCNPDSSWCLPKKTTPLVNIDQNLYAKLEGVHPGGSIKDRAVGQCVYGMLSSGKLMPGGTLACCTSGSAGISLLHVQKLLLQKGIAINVKIFMPKAYLPKDSPKMIAETPGVEVVDVESDNPSADGVPTRRLCPLDGLFVDVLGRMKELALERGWAVLDQHYDVNGMLAHQSTGHELLKQLPSITDVVCTTGTGATAAGLRKFLPARVSVHARPADSGSISGLCDVRRYANFCNTDLLEDYSSSFFDPDVAIEHQMLLARSYGIHTGPSGGAAFALAKIIAKSNSKAQVAFVCADGISTSLKKFREQRLDGEYGWNPSSSRVKMRKVPGTGFDSKQGPHFCTQ